MPETLGGSPVSIHLYVEDVDAFFTRALAAGAKERKPVMDQFYGDRSGQLEDLFGHLWWVATHTQDVAPEEMQMRVEAMFAAYRHLQNSRRHAEGTRREQAVPHARRLGAAA